MLRFGLLNLALGARSPLSCFPCLVYLCLPEAKRLKSAWDASAYFYLQFAPALSLAIRCLPPPNTHGGISRMCPVLVIGAFCSQHLYFIYMERASGGELFDQLTTFNGPIPEHVVRGFISQLAAGIAHCHRCCVAHRDIKLENALLSDTGVVKLIDFGLSHLYERDPDTGVADRRVPIHGYCGSKSYAAPEVLAGRGYDGFLADVWSLGVSMFGLLNGFFPVDEAKNTDWRFQKLCRAQELNKSSTATIMGWYKKSPDHLSAEARDLIDAMLNINPVKRPSIEQVLNHPFITGKDPSKDQFSQNSVYDNDPTVANIYRGAAIQHANFVMDDVEIMEDRPVYRSMGGMDDDLGDDFETGAMPGLTRQVAFGGADSVKDLFLP